MFANILVPLDGSKAAEAALEQATYLASLSDGKVRLVQVLSDSRLLENPGVRPDLREEWEMRDRSQAEEYLETIASRLQGEGVDCIARVLDAGNPVQQILEATEVDAVDLIVLTSHGRSGLARFLLGSVAERILRHAGCPVLVVRRNP